MGFRLAAGGAGTATLGDVLPAAVPSGHGYANAGPRNAGKTTLFRRKLSWSSESCVACGIHRLLADAWGGAVLADPSDRCKKKSPFSISVDRDYNVRVKKAKKPGFTIILQV